MTSDISSAQRHSHFFKNHFIFTKNIKLYVKLISFSLKYDSYYVNIFIKIQVTVASKDQTDQQFITMISDISSAQRHSHFFKTHFIFTKKSQIICQIDIFFPKIRQLSCQYFYQNSGNGCIKSLL